MSILSVLAWPYTCCHDQAEQESKAAQEASLRAGTAGRPHGLGPTHATRRLSERSVSAQALGWPERSVRDLCWRSPIGDIMSTSLPPRRLPDWPSVVERRDPVPTDAESCHWATPGSVSQPRRDMSRCWLAVTLKGLLDGVVVEVKGRGHLSIPRSALSRQRQRPMDAQQLFALAARHYRTGVRVGQWARAALSRWP